MHRPHVALIVPSFDVGAGVETPAMTALAEALRLHADVTVLALRYPPGPGRFNVNGIPVVALGGAGMRTRLLLWRTWGALRAVHRRKPFDVLHGVWLFEPGFIAATAGRLLRVPSMASVGGVEVVALPDIGVGGLLNRRGRMLSRFVLNRAGLVTGGSRFALAHARRVAPLRAASAFRLAPLPVNTDLFAARSEAVADVGSFRLLHVANLNAVKDQATLLRAFATVRRARPEAKLKIVGADPAGMRAGLDQLAAALDIETVVTFRELIPQRELLPVYRAADTFVITSRYESQAMVVLEAAASGVPTVGTAVGVVPDLSPDAAIATPVGDPAALADALLRLAGDADLRRGMGQAALARVQVEYAYAPVAQRFADLYAELMYGRIAVDPQR